MPSPSAFDHLKATAPYRVRERHAEAGEFQGWGELAPVVIWPLEVIAIGLWVGLAVCDELLWGGPTVLGRDAHGR